MDYIRKSIIDISHAEVIEFSNLYAVPMFSVYRSLKNNRELNAQKLTKEILEKVILSPEVNFNKLNFMGYEKNIIDFRARSLKSIKHFMEFESTIFRYSTHGPNDTTN